MLRDHCKECQITLTEYEKEELKDQCLDCYRESHNVRKPEARTVQVRLKNKKFFSHLS